MCFSTAEVKKGLRQEAPVVLTTGELVAVRDGFQIEIPRTCEELDQLDKRLAKLSNSPLESPEE